MPPLYAWIVIYIVIGAIHAVVMAVKFLPKNYGDGIDEGLALLTSAGVAVLLGWLPLDIIMIIRILRSRKK